MPSKITRPARTTPATATFKRTSHTPSPTSKHHSSSFITSTTSNTSSSYTFTATVPNVKNPYIIHQKGKNGSIFIIVGSVIIALIAGIILARFWFWLKNRKATNDEKLLDDYYGGALEKTTSGFLNYDPIYFDREKSAFNLSIDSSPESKGSPSSHLSTSSGGNSSRIDLNNLTTQPGRALRGPSQIPAIRRNSFISPLNELINESNIDLIQDSNKHEIYAASKNGSTSIETTVDSGLPLHARNKSMSLLFNDISPKSHNRARSVHLDSVEQLVNQSLIDLDKSGISTSDRQTTKPKRSRPASQVLDMLVLQDDNEI